MKLPLKKYYDVRAPGGAARLWTISQDESIAFAQRLWREEHIVCTITEVPHVPSYYRVA